MDLNDFDDTLLTLIFQADENQTEPRNEIELRIPITDDAINEANEQDFVVITLHKDSVSILTSLMISWLKNLRIFFNFAQGFTLPTTY